jgi:hypothetical protein
MNQTDPRSTSEEPLLNQVRLGGSGVHVSRLALGMMSFGDTSKRAWVLDEHAAEPIVRRAIEGGITFFDTSDILNKPDLTAPILGATKLAHIAKTGSQQRPSSYRRRDCPARRASPAAPGDRLSSLYSPGARWSQLQPARRRSPPRRSRWAGQGSNLRPWD